MNAEKIRGSPLPISWRWTTLGDVCENPQYGWTTSAAPNGDLHLLRTTDITSGHISWQDVPFCKELPSDLDRYLLHDGDIVISRAGSIGFSCLVRNPPESVFASYLIRFRPKINPDYVYYFLQSPLYWKAIHEASAGIALQNINATKLKKIPIPVPPLAEQRIIVEEIEKKLSSVVKGQTLLSRSRRLLQQYSRKVMESAVDGSLTKKWRESVYSSVSFSHSGYIPFGWTTHSVEELSEKIVDCPHSTPKYGSGECYCVDTTCIRPGSLLVDKLRKVDSETFAQRNKRLKPQAGDIVFAREGTIGTAVTLPESPKVCLGQRVMLIRPNRMVLSKYLETALMSERVRNQYSSKLVGSTVHHLNVRDVVKIVVPIPPLDEQKEIIRLVGKQMTITENLQRGIESGLIQVDLLKQSILKMAFHGELIPNDFNGSSMAALTETPQKYITTGKQDQKRNSGKQSRLT